jgi:acetyl-CoA synthetase
VSESHVYPIPASFADAHIGADDYAAMYRAQSMTATASFAKWRKSSSPGTSPGPRSVPTILSRAKRAGSAAAKLNVSVNCIDRHLPARAEQTAIIWEGDDPADSKHISYAELKDEVCRLANALRARGVKKGDRVCLYMPMVPEAAYAMLACTRIGAVHTIVFGGFSPEALKDRIQSADCSALITADEGLRGGRTVPLKANADKSLEQCPGVSTCIVVRRTGADIDMQDGRDVYYDEITGTQSTDCEPESMDAEDPLFILYTSGSTGKPKGVLHTTGGYLLQAAMTFKYVFDYRDGEVYWCTADVGWVTGHSYIVYGPLANGATTLMFEGVPTYPDAGRCWEIVDKYNVATFTRHPQRSAPSRARAMNT